MSRYPTEARGLWMPSPFCLAAENQMTDGTSLDQKSESKDPLEISDGQKAWIAALDQAREEHRREEEANKDAQAARFQRKKGKEGRGIFYDPDSPRPRRYRFLLHQNGINVNGCLPCHAPLYHLKEMDEEATQQLTQQVVDPRRAGKKSMLRIQDEADVLCILHPSSVLAFETVEHVAETTPQHLLQNQCIPGIAESRYAGAGDKACAADSPTGLSDFASTFEDAAGSEKFYSGRDIALRMSSKIVDPTQGFIFGRVAGHCDIVLKTDHSLVSGKHFRIFLNKSGVLMLEDSSTNGTYVDRTHLSNPPKDRKSNPYAADSPPRQTLNSGSIIDLPFNSAKPAAWIRFIVRIPSRPNAQKQYEQNIAAYLQYISQAERQAQVAKLALGKLPPAPPMPFNPLNHQPEETSVNQSLLAAATAPYNHGAEWDGGDKYNVVGYIGKGAFAMVYKVSTRSEGEVYAAKQIEKRRFIKDGQLGSKVHHEITIMERLKHPNIVQFVEYQETASHIYIIMEYVRLGDLTMYTSRGIAMNEFMAQAMASQICSALKYLHEEKITHRDIKPDNILMALHQPYLFKLSDFGLSKIVKDEDTFLKTFCGTILYCAPEIYPGFQRVKMGIPAKRTRHWDQPKERTLPYKHSVDTWGIAAVLFHLLCGRPAWTGTMENQGAVMLENIMNIPVEWERLEQAGVSETGIDFLSKMLVVEPSLRATEDQQLSHPWIVQALRTQGGGIAAQDPSHPEPLDASQLSIADDGLASEDDYEQDEFEDARQSKRIRAQQQSPSHVDVGETLKPMYSEHDDDAPSWNENHPAWRLAQAQQRAVERPAGAGRLFGEISVSALKSSGALGSTDIDHLDVPMGGANEPFSNISSIDPNYPGPSATNPNPEFPVPRVDHETRHYAHSRNTSSLMGAEDLVDQLNMASPRSAASGHLSDGRPAGLGTRKPLLEDKPSASASWESSLDSDDGEGVRISKRRGKGARHNGENGHSEGNHNSYNDGQRFSNLNRSKASLLPTTFNSQESEGASQIYTNDGSAEGRHMSADAVGPDYGITSSAHARGGRFTKAEQISPFADPAQRFGDLVAVPGSIPTVSIRIASRSNSFGRDPTCTFPHPDIKADRVPKNALDITMYYPGIDQDIERGSTDWHQREDITALVSTRTTRYIKVNGVRLMRGQGCWYYGKLRTGDIITIFEPVEGRTPRTEDEKLFLKFRCEFYHGASKAPRTSGEPFVVQREELSAQEVELRKSQASLSRSR